MEQIKNEHAVALGRKGGQAKSDKKTHAVRINSQKGGEAMRRKWEEIRGKKVINILPTNPA